MRTSSATIATVVALGMVASVSGASAADWTLVTGDDSGTVTRVDAATGAGLGPATTLGGEVWAIAITPDGRTAYAVDSTLDTVSEIDLASGSVEATIPVSGDPEDIAITPDGRTAFVSRYNANSVVGIDLATDTVGTPIQLSGNPQGVAIAPDGRSLYVTEYTGNAVVPIDLATGAVGSAIPAGTAPSGIAITPDGSTAYVADYGGSTLYPIDLATDTALPPITVGTAGYSDAVSPDGGTAYVTQFASSNTTPVELATGTAGIAIPTGAEPTGVTFAPNGETAYVASFAGNVATPITVATGVSGTPFTVGVQPRAIAITPDQAPTAAFAVTPGPAGQSSTLDGSASSSPVGSIASYEWDFGDGKTAITTTPTVQHTYAAVGTYTVRLTVTNTAGTSTTQVFTGQTVSREGGPSATTTHAITVAQAVKGQPPTESVSGLRESPRRVTLTGHRVHGRCIATTRADRHATSCRLAFHVRLRYTLHTDQTRGGVTLTVSRLLPGRRVGRRCVATTATNRLHHARCTRTRRVSGSIRRSPPAGVHTLVFNGRIGGRRLGPGTYRLTLSAGNRQSVKLTIVR
jgi:YVTN family beta-propeller protein